MPWHFRPLWPCNKPLTMHFQVSTARSLPQSIVGIANLIWGEMGHTVASWRQNLCTAIFAILSSYGTFPEKEADVSVALCVFPLPSLFARGYNQLIFNIFCLMPLISAFWKVSWSLVGPIWYRGQISPPRSHQEGLKLAQNPRLQAAVQGEDWGYNMLQPNGIGSNTANDWPIGPQKILEKLYIFEKLELGQGMPRGREPCRWFRSS